MLLTRRWVTPYNNSIFQISESEEAEGKGVATSNAIIECLIILAGCKFVAVPCPFVVAIGKPPRALANITSGNHERVFRLCMITFLSGRAAIGGEKRKRAFRFLRVSLRVSLRVGYFIAGYAREGPPRPHSSCAPLCSLGFYLNGR